MARPDARVTPHVTSRFVLHALMIASGAAGLGYQIAWTRMFSAGLGHEVPGMLAVVSAFFAGLALGSFTLDRFVGRARTPGRWYVGLELAIGLWALFMVALIPAMNELAYALIGAESSPVRHWAVAFILPAITLLPATTAMGATLPAMDRIAEALDPTSKRHVGGLYASNTLGAVIGTLASAFALLPALGYTRTTIIFASINIAVALLAFVLWRSVRAPADPEDIERERRLPGARLAATLFITGLLGIGYEVLAVRVMGQVLENTVYSFASGLSAFLIGTAFGGALYQRFLSARTNPTLLHYLLILLSASVLFGVLMLGQSAGVYEDFRETFGPNRIGAVLAELSLALLVFLPPTVAMGMVFSHLAQISRRESSGVGFAFGINTVGSSLASLVFGVFLLPAIGAKISLIAIALSYLLLMPTLARRVLPAVTLPLALAGIALTADLALVEPPPGGRTIWRTEGVLGTVAVVANPEGERLLTVNNKFNMGGVRRAPSGELTAFAEPRQAHIPLLLRGGADRALFLGVGTGATIGATRHWTGLRATGVELVPEVVEATRFFEGAIGEWRTDESIDIVAADARRFVRADDGAYDVIVADLFHPSRDGAGTLYTVEHFRAIRERLDEGGLFCQWLPLYQLDVGTVRLIVRTFLEVYPNSIAVLSPFNVETPMLGLVGGEGIREYSFGWTRGAIDNARLERALLDLQLREDLDLFGSVLATGDTLHAFAGKGRLNTDDHPIVVYEAPSYTYSAQSTKWGTLIALLDTFGTPAPGEVLRIEEGDITARANALRLEKYWRARNTYLGGLAQIARGETADGLETVMDAAELSRDFDAAGQTLRGVAPSIMRTNPALGRRIRALLEELDVPAPISTRQLPGGPGN